ncbi:hypothetical protein [Laspinema olomoucense]|uniref:hypothetical protein n=1 Tax=Laspinema olomoucense TaxID=3231600 RepID=UPI0021BB2963|nr:hypothetical protein [Laspinema sp. D3a]MCT7991339.1 hypothetical protein [Laspinema sp. D3a]
MNITEFEVIVSDVVTQLNQNIRICGKFPTSKQFEDGVRNILTSMGLSINYEPHPHVFPDIPLGEFGIEVKFTTNDTWRSIANSVFEGMRDPSVEHIYLIFGKMGGEPEVRWGKYDDCVMHVRTSHVPRFEVDMTAEESLFEQMGTTYESFSKASDDQKMAYVRAYARKRLKPGERLWWLEEKEEQEHTLPLQVRIYMNLDQNEKRKLRAEAAILCPQIVKPSRSKDKYSDAVSYMLTYRGVLCPQARDLFSAGSVALRADSARGGNYIQRALDDIESEMRIAALTLEDALFEEYWGMIVPSEKRIATWLAMADSYAQNWIPSEELFRDNTFE